MNMKSRVEVRNGKYEHHFSCPRCGQDLKYVMTEEKFKTGCPVCGHEFLAYSLVEMQTQLLVEQRLAEIHQAQSEGNGASVGLVLFNIVGFCLAAATGGVAGIVVWLVLFGFISIVAAITKSTIVGGFISW